MISLESPPLEILEKKVTILLQEYAKDQNAQDTVAPHIAKVSLLQNHLYEDLGFANRKEMSDYMQRHFPVLSRQKPVDKLWKKYIYDSIGEVAPACATCSDQNNCFQGNCIP